MNCEFVFLCIPLCVVAHNKNQPEEPLFCFFLQSHDSGDARSPDKGQEVKTRERGKSVLHSLRCYYHRYIDINRKLWMLTVC